MVFYAISFFIIINKLQDIGTKPVSQVKFDSPLHNLTVNLKTEMKMAIHFNFEGEDAHKLISRMKKMEEWADV